MFYVTAKTHIKDDHGDFGIFFVVRIISNSGSKATSVHLHQLLSLKLKTK